jgi:hypothetical protein
MLALWLCSSTGESSVLTPWTCSAGFHPALPHGDIRLSQVPELSLCVHALLSRPRWRPFRLPFRYGDCCLPLGPSVGFGSDGLELSYRPPLYVFRDSMTRPAHLFRPASHLPLRERTRTSLPICRLSFDRVGLEQAALAPTGQQ